MVKLVPRTSVTKSPVCTTKGLAGFLLIEKSFSFQINSSGFLSKMFRVGYRGIRV
jgi:hypothetical protein